MRRPAVGTAALLTFATLSAVVLPAGAKLVQQSWDADQMITNYYKPWDTSQHSADQLFAAYKPGQTRMALLANDSLPGPLLAAELGDDIEITVNNLAQQEVTDIHWHGMPQRGTPWADGAYMVSGCGIPPVTGSYTYRFKAEVPGTRFWHSHVQQQLEWGLFGPLIVHDPQDPYRGEYDEEIVLMLHEWWQDPDALQLGSPLLVNQFRIHLVNGIFGNGTADFPHYQVQVAPGKRYRLRVIAIMGEDVGYRMTVAGHSLDVIAVEGNYVTRTPASSIALYIGSRYDAILTADQPPGAYLVQFESVQREELLEQLPPVLRFAFVLSYNSSAQGPQGLVEGAAGVGSPPPTADPSQPVISAPPGPGEDIDVNKRPGALRPLQPEPLPAVTREPITLFLGATISTQAIEMWGFQRAGEQNQLPYSPLLLSRGRCGAGPKTRVMELANGTVVDIVLNNLMDEVHPQHLHGHTFWVLGSGYSGNLTDSEVPAQAWGCPFKNASDGSALNLASPYQTDTVLVPAHSWAVIRVRFDNPGVWPFHCHKIYHDRLGMAMFFVVGADVQPPIPAEALGQCRTCDAAGPEGQTG